MRGKLYLVGTPIGNLSDITLRALETLKTVDIIACEDTRHTLALLNRYEIKKPLVSYYKHKEKEGTEKIVGLLEEGKTVALVTDAGMPCVSDPGAILVKRLYELGYDYTVVPGASAVVCAAALSGTEKGFTFLGFLPEKKSLRDEAVEKIADLPHTTFIYAAPHDVNDILEYLYEKLGDREICIVKEITKIYESVVKGTLSKTRVENPKGEFVIGIEPKNEIAEIPTDEKIIEEIKKEILSGTAKKEAVKIVAEKLKVSKNTVYKLSLDI